MKKEDLEKSEKEIGQIFPVLKDKKGNIIDGFHRKRINPEWKEEVLPIDDELKSLKVRVHANILRRAIPTEEKEGWVKQAREFLGRDATQKEIAVALGMSQQWVAKYDEPIRIVEKDKTLPRHSKESDYNVLGFKSKKNLKKDLKDRIIGEIPKDSEIERGVVERVIEETVEKLDDFFFIKEGNKEQPDKEFYHGSTPAFIIETLLEKFKPKSVLDTMAGVGTTGWVCKKYNIECDQYDITPYPKFDVKEGDAETIEPNKTYDLIFNHIPYWNMVKYSENPQDLSVMSWDVFKQKLEKIFLHNHKLLNKNKIYAVLVGDWRH